MAKPKAFTEREMYIMGMAWLCFSEQPKPDYAKLADLCGFTHVGSASNAWSGIKKKLTYLAEHSSANDDDEVGITNIKTPSKVSSRKRSTKAAAVTDASPTKKAKGRNGKAKPAPAQDGSDEEVEQNDESVNVAVKEELEGSNSDGDQV